MSNGILAVKVFIYQVAIIVQYVPVVDEGNIRLLH